MSARASVVRSLSAAAVLVLVAAGLSGVACGRGADAPEPAAGAADSVPRFIADTQMIVDSLGNELMIVSKRTAHLLPREVHPRAGAGDPGAPDAWRVIDPRAAWSLMQAATPAWYVIDVRDSRAFATRGHLRGAALVPLEVLEANVSDLHVRSDQIVLVYADDEARAARAARILAGYGFPNLRVLGGGIAAWERDSLPVERR
ncbi:MAG TPA: rhodanese-like domain-containing protein [Gemmatimonadota bacterium]|nr:rhodanese-like domain-containing protein [Gemmatimonadota bacterium]